MTWVESPAFRRTGAAGPHSRIPPPVLAFSPDGRTLVSDYGQDEDSPGLVVLWDVAAGKYRTALRGHTGRVNTVAFAADGRAVTTAGTDGVVKPWDVVTGQERLTLRGLAGRTLRRAFAADGRALVAGGEGGKRLLPAATKEESEAPPKEP